MMWTANASACAHVGAGVQLAELDVAARHGRGFEDLFDYASGAGNNL